MTIDDFWKKYNHCPLCRAYASQGAYCDGCKWESPLYEHRPDNLDKFDPKPETIEAMNREITE